MGGDPENVFEYRLMRTCRVVVGNGMGGTVEGMNKRIKNQFMKK
jgi:hypothetical protein